MNKNKYKHYLQRHYTTYEWLIIHNQPSADLWLLNLFANELITLQE